MNTNFITKAAKYCLYALMLIGAINIISNIMRIDLIYSYFVYDEVFSVLAEKNEARVKIVSTFYSVIYFSSIFIIGGWIYLSSKANHLLEIKNLKYSPGWCVGWYFIPFANLVIPYRALKQIYKASFNVENWQKIKIPHAFPAWWTTWIIGHMIAAVSAVSLSINLVKLDEPLSYEDLNLISYFKISINFFEILCAFFLLKIITVISNNHQKINFKIADE